MMAYSSLSYRGCNKGADLMVNFYQQLGDNDKAEALRRAKLQLILQNRYAHPYYWAPFVLVGDPK